MTENGPDEPANEHMPDEIRAALRRRYGGRSQIPRETDQVILAHAAAHWQSLVNVPQKTRRSRLRILMSVATVSVAMLLLMVLPRQGHDRGEQFADSRAPSAINGRQSDFGKTEFGGQMAGPDAEGSAGLSGNTSLAAGAGLAGLDAGGSAGLWFQDIDRDGRIDILDAFALARAIHAGATPDSARDQNGDGRVDQADIDALAMAAVML